MRPNEMFVAVVGITIALCTCSSPRAADIQVFAAGVGIDPARALSKEFTAATRHEVVFSVATPASIQQRLAAGEKADLVILGVPLLDALNRSGALRPGNQRALARVGLGMSAKDGEPLPDIGTVTALRATLLG